MTGTYAASADIVVKLDGGTMAVLGEEMFGIPAEVIPHYPQRPTSRLGEIGDPFVLLDLNELRKLRAAGRPGRRPKAIVLTSTGSAHYMGDDEWYVSEYDDNAQAWYDTMITCGDVERMLAAAA